MHLINTLIQTIGGLGLFLLGMKTMTEGLEMTAGPKIKKVNEQEALEISELMRITNNIERIGDGIENVFKIMERIDDMRISMSQEALDDLQTIANEVHTFMQFVIQELYEKTENFLSKAKVQENRIDQIRERLRAQHIERLRQDACSVDAGVLFITLISTSELFT